MSRYIKFDDLKADMIIEKRDFMSCGVHLDYASVRGVSLSQILTAPSIDIVRCKECTERDDDWCMYFGNIINPDDFCSYGESEGE